MERLCGYFVTSKKFNLMSYSNTLTWVLDTVKSTDSDSLINNETLMPP